MTGKRFQSMRRVDDFQDIYDSETDECLKIRDTVHLLNKLNDENEQLRKTINRQDITIGTINANLEKLMNESELLNLLQNEQYKSDMLEKENEQLKSIKKFAEDRGINIFSISEAFQRCWEDNAKLVEENEQLRKENEQLRHELDSLSGCYCADNKEFKDYWRIGYDD